MKETELTPRQVARDLGLPLHFPRRRRRQSVNIAPSWDQVLEWAVEAYWERKGRHVDAA
jgi:hypothetical protein